MQVSTRDLKDAVARAIKGASFNSTLPITSLMGIQRKENKLMFSTTSITNQLSIIIDCTFDSEDELDSPISVDASVLSKLVAKLTIETTKLEVKDNNLVVHCDGTYKLPLVTDDNGNVVVKVPGIRKTTGEVRLSAIMSAYNTNRTSIAKNDLMPVITGYYCDEDGVVTTDATIITKNDSVIFNEPMLIPAQMLSLLTLNTVENIPMSYANNALQFVTDDCIITGPILLGIQDYPIDSIKEYFNMELKDYCVVNKNILLACLDRLSLFVEPYDKNVIKLAFHDSLVVSSKKASSVEYISYLENDGGDAECLVSINHLITLLQSARGDNVKIYYGNSNALVIDSENVTQVLALDSEEG